jgi:antitoxin CptB
VGAPHPPGPASSPVPLDSEARRLLWHCRRGLKELDVMLERFAHHALQEACPRQRRALEELLSLPDPLLAAYLLGESTPPEPHLAALAGAIRTYVAKEGGSALF